MAQTHTPPGPAICDLRLGGPQEATQAHMDTHNPSILVPLVAWRIALVCVQVVVGCRPEPTKAPWRTSGLPRVPVGRGAVFITVRMPPHGQSHHQGFGRWGCERGVARAHLRSGRSSPGVVSSFAGDRPVSTNKGRWGTQLRQGIGRH